MIRFLLSLYALLAFAGCATTTSHIVERPLYSVWSPQWKVTLSSSATSIEPDTDFLAGLTLLNDSKKPAQVPIDMEAFFSFGIQSQPSSELLAGRAIVTWLYEPPAVETMVRCRELAPGESVSFTRREVSPHHPGRYELVTNWSAVSPLAFEVAKKKLNQASEPTAPSGRGSL